MEDEVGSVLIPLLPHHTRLIFLKHHSDEVPILLKNLFWLPIVQSIVEHFQLEMKCSLWSGPHAPAFLISQPSLHVPHSASKCHDTFSAFLP